MSPWSDLAPLRLPRILEPIVIIALPNNAPQLVLSLLTDMASQAMCASPYIMPFEALDQNLAAELIPADKDVEMGFQEGLHQACFAGKLPQFDPDIWNAFPHALHPSLSRNGAFSYVVHRSHPYARSKANVFYFDRRKFLLCMRDVIAPILLDPVARFARVNHLYSYETNRAHPLSTSGGRLASRFKQSRANRHGRRVKSQVRQVRLARKTALRAGLCNEVMWWAGSP